MGPAGRLGIFVALLVTSLGGEAAARDCVFERSAAARDSCYDRHAFRLRNASLCDSIENADRRIWCRIKVDPSPAHAALCEDVEKTELRSACFRHAAIQLLDASLCQQLSHPYYQKDCAEQVGYRSDPSDPCHQLEHGERQRCYVGRALAEVDPSLCSRIGGPHEYQCFEKALPRLVDRAARRADWGACERAGEKRDECIIRLSARLGTSARCAALKSGHANRRIAHYAHDRCLEAVAESLGQASLCQAVFSETARGGCIMKAAVFPRECEAAGHTIPHERNACFMRLAQQLGDRGVCAAIDTEPIADQCREFAGKAGRCGSLGPEYRDDCYLRRSAHTRRASCSRVADPAKRAACPVLANPAGGVQGCEGLEEPYRERCVIGVALAQGSAAPCGRLGDARSRGWCEGLISGAALPPGPCDEIVDPELRRECEGLARER